MGDVTGSRRDLTVPAESSDRFMGRCSRRLAPSSADVAGAARSGSGPAR